MDEDIAPIDKAPQTRQINREAVYVTVSSLLVLAIIYLMIWISGPPVGPDVYVILISLFVAAPALIALPLADYFGGIEIPFLGVLYWISLIALIAASIYWAWRLGARLKIPDAFTLGFIIASLGTAIVCGIIVLEVLSLLIIALFTWNLPNVVEKSLGILPFIAVIGFVSSLPMAFICSATYLWMVRPLLVKLHLVVPPYSLKPVPSKVKVSGKGRPSLWPE